MKLIFKILFKAYQHFLFKKIVFKNDKPILLLDIDNTLAYSWQSLTTDWRSNSDRIKNLSPINGIIDYLKCLYPIETFEWVFVTNRSYTLRRVTINWLLLHKLPADNSNVILVQSPMEKISLIVKYVSKRAVYYDDLSYNHEYGEVKFYSDEIERCSSLKNLQYFGYHEILKIINNE